MEITALSSHELEVARALLAANDLPVDDLADPTVTLFGAKDGAELVGVIGLQRCDRVALLRSLAVAPTARDRGIGARLCERVFEIARDEGLDPIYLLTTSASDYFQRLGFTTVDRDRAPPAIRATTQFAALCPSTATVMCRTGDR